MAEVTKSLRYRVNVSQTSTGKKGFDCTVELDQSQTVMPIAEAQTSMDDVLLLSDTLVRELEKRYPPPESPGMKESK